MGTSHHKVGLALGAMTALVLWSGRASAGPITFNTALPVHKNEVIVREQLIWSRYTNDPTDMGRRLNVLTAPTVVVYGPHPKIALFGILPFHYKNLSLQTPRGRRTRSTSGFGDMRLLSRFTVLALNRKGKTVRLAPFAGLKLPTGADDEADALGRFPQPFQLGTGSWDPTLGAIFTRQTLRWELDLSGGYELRTPANGFDAGDEARGDASLQVRVVPWGKLGGGIPQYLYVVAESNVIWRGEDQVEGVNNPDSGGLVWYVAPGLQWITKRTVVEAAAQIPAVQAPNGKSLRKDLIARLSFRVNF